MKRTWYILIVIIIIVVAVIAVVLLDQGKKAQAPHNEDDTATMSMSPASNDQPVSTTAVTISNFAFDPTTITVKVGDTVTWTNNDSTSHTVTSDDGQFDSGTILKGATYKHAFSKAGEYGYHCTLHPDMKAKVIVQ